jgi:hypothetical protein
MRHIGEMADADGDIGGDGAAGKGEADQANPGGGAPKMTNYG